jgi:hypothetical protein
MSLSQDELLRAEFSSRDAALAANQGKRSFLVTENRSPLVKVGELAKAPLEVFVSHRVAVLKEFDFPWGTRWKFCLVPLGEQVCDWYG